MRIWSHHASVEATKLLQVDLTRRLLKACDGALGKEEAKHSCSHLPLKRPNPLVETSTASCAVYISHLLIGISIFVQGKGCL